MEESCFSMLQTAMPSAGTAPTTETKVFLGYSVPYKDASFLCNQSAWQRITSHVNHRAANSGNISTFNPVYTTQQPRAEHEWKMTCQSAKAQP